MIGIQELAQEVGVSTATVSRALRGLPRVSEETRSRVMEAALRLGYVPSPHAAGLASGNSRTIAIVVPFVTRWYFSMVVQGAEEVLRGRGYDVLLYNLAGDASTRHRLMSTHALTKRVDAVLLVGMTPTPTEVLWLQGAGHPVVTLGVEVTAWPSVRIDDERVSHQAVDHLVGLGHRRIAFVGGLEPVDVFDFTTPELRQRGYRAAMAEHGLEVEDGWEQEGLFTSDGGVAAGERILALPERPTAVYAASDEMAIGVVHALRAAGVDVPGEVSVVGVDDHEMARFFDLTTIRQPVQEQGRRAAARVLRLLDDEAGGAAPTREVVDTEVVVRATTAAPAG